MDAATELGPVTLRVADAGGAASFYQEVIGLQRVPDVDGLPALGAPGGSPLVILREVPGARPAPRAAGLFHVAVLVPTRADLGKALRRLAEAGVGIGQADHLVSEALYLSDPDGNGIEIYRDRPRSEWKWTNGAVEMATEPLDLESILREGDEAGGESARMPAGTRIGHVHLQAGSVAEAVRFYHELIGFDVTASWSGAAFLSAGGYHHHLGLNSWASRGAAPAPAGSTGIDSFEIRVPRAEDVDRIAHSLGAAGVSFERDAGDLRAGDPMNVEVRVRVGGGSAGA